MTKKFLYMAVLSMMTATASVSAEEKEIVSPDGRVTVRVSDEGGTPKYQVSLGGVVFIQPSALGLNLNFDDLTQGLTMTACDVSKLEDEYWLKTTKQSQVKVEATEAVCRFQKDGRQALDIIFRVATWPIATRFILREDAAARRWPGSWKTRSAVSRCQRVLPHSSVRR
jgi:hypothetical protein